MKAHKILGVIPARGGSKGIPRKNLYPLMGRPLIEYTFEAAKKSRYLSRIILTTDDEEIASLGKDNGIEIPFLRPDELALDNTSTLPVIQHTVNYLEENEGYLPDIIVILQPTSPLRKARHIDEGVKLLIDTGADSVVSVAEVPHQYNPVSLMKIENGKLNPFLKNGKMRAMSKQDKPKLYTRNGAVYLMRYEVLMKQNSLFGKDCHALIMDADESVDIDKKIDIELAAILLKNIKNDKDLKR